MCEWVYVIDLDDGCFDIYKGFNKEKISHGRFKSDDETLEKSAGYEPVKLVKTYSIDSLPSLEQFIADLEPEEEEE